MSTTTRPTIDESTLENHIISLKARSKALWSVVDMLELEDERPEWSHDAIRGIAESLLADVESLAASFYGTNAKGGAR
ncbi:MAG TPA: hypothetical protein VFA27_16735 [Vicinamibacterales bacterium]|nr:hypothetical protein [Vicinamibacterales bacterium]